MRKVLGAPSTPGFLLPPPPALGLLSVSCQDLETRLCKELQRKKKKKVRKKPPRCFLDFVYLDGINKTYSSIASGRTKKEMSVPGLLFPQFNFFEEK